MLVVCELQNGFDVSSGSAESVEDLLDASTWLHGDDSQLIFLVNPDQERLCIIVEDTSSWWPVSVEVACLQESVTLLEQEMVIDEFLWNFWAHTIKWVEGTLQVTFEWFASLNNFIHDFKSLFLGDSWSEWISSTVSSNSNSSGVYHCWVFLWEIGVDKSFWRHVWSVCITWAVTMILLNNFIEKFVKFSIWGMVSSIETDSWVLVLDTWEDHSLEGNTSIIWLVFILVPDFSGQISF